MKKTLIILLLSVSVCFAQSLEWVKQFEGNGFVRLDQAVTDNTGNMYLSGVHSNSMDLDPGPGIDIDSGLANTFVVKLDPTGNYLWGHSFKTFTAGNTIVLTDVDDLGNVYLSGNAYDSCDVDPGPGVTMMNASAGIFILKLNAAGNFVWLKQFECIYHSGVQVDFQLDENGNIYGCGFFFGTYPMDFDPGPGTFLLSGNSEGFFYKLDSLGNFVWAKKIDSDNFSYIENVDINSSGEVALIGYNTGITDIDPNMGTYYFSDTSKHAFIAKYSSTGNLIWAKNFNGEFFLGTLFHFGLTYDNQENIVAYGHYKNMIDLDPGVGVQNVTSNGLMDGYLIKLDPSGDYIWGKSFGDSDIEKIHDVDVDSYNNIFLSISSYSTTIDLDPNAGTQNFTSPTGGNYISSLDQSGNYLWGVQNSTPISTFWSNIICFDYSNNLIVAGKFDSIYDFDFGTGTAILDPANGNLFMEKIGNLNLGLTENAISDIEIFPNPAVDVLYFNTGNISSEKLNISICDINGRIVWENSIQNTYCTIAVTTTHWTNGIYFFNCNGTIRKFIKN